MNKTGIQNTVAAIDIGTTKICVLVGGINIQGHLEVIGVGQYPSHGMKKGVIVNITQTVSSIKRAIAAAEKMAQVKVQSATVGISGGHISSFNSRGVVAIRKGDVTQYDIDRVIDASKAVPIPKDRQILHVIPQYFRVDNQEYVQDSLGMVGVRLEAHVHIITGNISSAQNIIRAAELAGVKVNDIVLEPLASADAVLGDSERELGVGMLDIGGGTSDFAIYKNGKIRHSRVFPVAGNHFTHDLAIGASVPIPGAESLKRLYGFVLEDKYLELDADSVEVALGYHDKTRLVDIYTVFEILQPRAQEIFELLRTEIDGYRLRALMPSGLIVTGGGCLLQGMPELAQSILGIATRIGMPAYYYESSGQGVLPDILKSPIYSTAYGLLVHTLKQEDSSLMLHTNDPLITRVFKRMKSWMYDFI